MENKKWKDDPGFTEWLLKMEYIKMQRGQLVTPLSNRLYLYMYEAYNQGKKPFALTVRKIDPYDYPFEFASFQGVF